MLTIIFSLIVLAAVLIVTYKAGYNAAKKNMLVHVFKEKMISPEQYNQLEKADI